GKRPASMDWPDRLLDVLQKPGIAGPVAANGERHGAWNVDPITPEVLHQHWPVDDRRRRPLHAVIVDVRGDTHDLAPRACRILTDAPAERGFGRPPVLARKFVGHRYD